MPGGMLYILDMLWLSAGLGGDGVLEVRPLWTDRMPLLSWLVLRSGSLFSPLRVSKLGRRLEATDGFRERSGRDALHDGLSERGFGGGGSARLGSVSSRISDKGRILDHEDALPGCPFGSPKSLPTMLLQLSVLYDSRNEGALSLSKGRFLFEASFSGACE